MSLSRWNRNLGIYTYSSTTNEGVATDVWTLAAVTFGRIDAKTTKSLSQAGMSEAQTDAVVELSDEIGVPANSVIVDGSRLEATTAFHVKGLPRCRRDQHRQYVDVVQLDRNKIDPSALLLDGSFVADGSNLLAGVGA